MSARQNGSVKWFSEQKGYGFISPEGGGGDDVFVHATALDKSGIPTLHDNDKVSFETEPSRKLGKLQACNIKVL
jgi:CspA family cold shock protein